MRTVREIAADIGITSARWRLFISAFIVVLIGLQAGTLFLPFGYRLYPFIGYHMYTNVHREGENLDVEYPLYMRLGTGREVQVANDDLGMNFFKLDRYLNRILRGNEDEGQMLMALYESRQDAAVESLRITTYPAIVTREGVKEVPSETLYSLERDPEWSGE